MKPPPFTYHAPASIEEAVGLLADLGDEACVLAGGQSLVPLLNLRRITPRHLVDINGLAEAGALITGRLGLGVGAVVRQACAERDPAARAAVPLLGQALRYVANPSVRNRGTVVGSLVNSDPCAELPAVMAVLRGYVHIARRGGARLVEADEFFTGPFRSCLKTGELAVCAYFPRPAGQVGTDFAEVSRRRGDRALCGVAALVRLDENGRISTARAAFASVADRPLVMDFDDVLADRTPERAHWEEVASLARARLSPPADLHAGAGYRRHLAGTLAASALRTAAYRARTHGIALIDEASAPTHDPGWRHG